MSDSSNTPEPDVNGGLLLGLSILATILCGPLTIATWISSNSAMRKFRDFGDRPSKQRSLVQAAQIISVVGMVIWIVGAVIRVSARSAEYGRRNSSSYSRY